AQSSVPNEDATHRLITNGAFLGHGWRETTAAAAKIDSGSLGTQVPVRHDRTNGATSRHATQDPADGVTVMTSATAGQVASLRRAAAKDAGVNPSDAEPVGRQNEVQTFAQHEVSLKSLVESLATEAGRQTAMTGSRMDEMVQRVERFQLMAEKFEQNIAALGEKGGGSMTIDLAPQSLGKMTLDCDVKDGVMSLKLIADSDGARNLLTEQVAAIREVVQNAGYTLAQLDVRTRGDGVDQRSAGSRQSGGTRRERKAGSEAGAVADVAGAMSGARYDDGHEHAVWLVA
ncbi:MAG: flagellar hook-length control protein FliK, partial [bacterium]